jgi:hypothetical protein
VGFEPTILVGERPQTYALDRAATGTGLSKVIAKKFTHARCEVLGVVLVRAGFKYFERDESHLTLKKKAQRYFETMRSTRPPTLPYIRDD